MKSSTASIAGAFFQNFLGESPKWFKQAIICFLILNPIVLAVAGHYATGWLIVVEFIFCLAMALHCYPLQSGGLIALETILMGMTTPAMVKHEILNSFSVFLLLIFMVAGIYFMKDLLLLLFTKLLVKIRSKTTMSLLFCFICAFLSAFLDALTVTAVVISVSVGFYYVYKEVEGKFTEEEGEQFRAFLRNILMHSVVGTALGGVCTMVGEPQNLIIADSAGWDFVEFFVRTAPVSLPVLVCGLITCFLVEKFKAFAFGAQIPASVRHLLIEHDIELKQQRTINDKLKLYVQALVAFILIFGLAFHIAEVGLIGLLIITLQTAFNGITEEHDIGKAFEEALPFTSLLVVFFVIVAMIHDQHLFSPILAWVFSFPEQSQAGILFIANGVLSMISDNVFVATVYIGEVKSALEAGNITREHFEKLAIAINTGTNLPSVATPNGQAAFLFLLTSAIAPVIKLSYGRMVHMALPYTIVLGVVGFLCVHFFL